MARTKTIGDKGEAIAISILRKKNHKILHQNWRNQYLEVDIISQIDGILVFTEVKTRSNLEFGEPHHFVTRKKQKNLFKAANKYCFEKDYYGEIRFDIISIYNSKENKPINAIHLEDAFYQYG